MEKQGFFSSSSGFSTTKDDDYKANKNLMLEVDFEPFSALFSSISLSNSIGLDDVFVKTVIGVLGELQIG
ncbi:hypothetical protein C5167_047690 [Papaver somniferum]|uniref:Uncharacterized protein n=1 Tax=Papaver somniferum TaxID=3469 RepID=A0A4Y7LHD4_PAPSO|nr:hypothetical protein C5167_047690 [Papaver somniferum]